MTQLIHHHRFANGLTLLGEEMPWLESAAFAILIPVGAAHDPEGRQGLGNFVGDMVQRGSGARESRQFVESLERLGVDRSSSVSLTHSSYSAATLASNLFPALSLYADLVRRPLFPGDQLEESRLVCCQEIRAAEDDLVQRTLEKVRQLQYPAPWGRPAYGEWDHVQSITLDDVQTHFADTYGPDEAIISVAGKLEWEALRDHVESLFGDWKPQTRLLVQETSTSEDHVHVPHESNQTHIAVAYPSVPYRNEDYYQARASVGVLSDGMSSRLFTEVREKQGLCYTIYASLNTLRDQGCVLCYSATSTDRAQQTLDTTLAELVRLREGIQESELDRLKARIKSSLIMQQESSASRAVSMAIDWYHLEAIRSLEEVSTKVNALTAESISEFLRRCPPGDFKVASLGAQPLEVSV